MREELWDPARGSLDYSCKDSSSSWWILKDQLELICIVLKDYFRAVCLNFFFLGKHWSGCRQKGQNPHLFSCFCFVFLCLFRLFFLHLYRRTMGINFKPHRHVEPNKTRRELCSTKGNKPVVCGSPTWQTELTNSALYYLSRCTEMVMQKLAVS